MLPLTIPVSHVDCYRCSSWWPDLAASELMAARSEGAATEPDLTREKEKETESDEGKERSNHRGVVGLTGLIRSDRRCLANWIVEPEQTQIEDLSK
uniref:Uncharacterized protein n=1 Tax=Oryza sativa subsp. japonica TaxID=39947 RepID=Q8GS37_ORYSJ|nr:hypothetical protein [Oryza sativa Japonica Group]BAC22474.1 hypothetical protein [Oryza sativa Japonica Group]